MRRRWLTALLTGLVALGGGLWLAFAADAHPGRSRPAHGPVALSYSVVGVGDALAAPATTFESIVPACGCARQPTEIAQFSLRTGRRLRTLARIRTDGQLTDARSDANGDLWLTFTAGPRLLAGGLAGGDPQPNSCTSVLVRFDPHDARTTVVERFPPSVTVTEAIPSPDGQRVALVEGGCATSFFNEHLVVIGADGGPSIAIGADATPCHSLGGIGWNPAGTELAIPFGPSTLPRDTHFVPNGTCAASRLNRLAVVSALRPSQPGDWHLWPAQSGCSYAAAAFSGDAPADRSPMAGGPDGIVASEACSAGLPRGSGGGTLGRAYLVALGDHGRPAHRWPLRFAWDGGDVVFDPANRQTLVSESEGGNLGVRYDNWVWALAGDRLRVVRHDGFQGASYLDAQPF